MTDWSLLRDAYGDASGVPDLLSRLSSDPDDDVWDELWSRLCHQGTVYGASFAALPRLLQWAQTQPPTQRAMVLALAGAIIGSKHVASGADSRAAAVEATASGFEQMGLETLSQPGLTLSDFIYVAEAVLAFRGEPIWGEQLDRLDSGEFEGVCMSCGTSLYLVVGQYGFFATRDEWVNQPDTRRVPIVASAAQSLVGVQRWLYDQAVVAHQERVAERLLHLFGNTDCPACGQRIAVGEAVERASGSTNG
jgi:hypothetical protein